MISPVARRPDDRVNIQRSPISEGQRLSRGVRHSRPNGDSGRANLSGGGSDQGRSAVSDPPTQPCLHGDLKTGVAAAHDDHGPAWDVGRLAVSNAVKLNHAAVEAISELRDPRHLKRAGCHHNLIRMKRPLTSQ